MTNSHGEGVHAALGLQVVDEAVFALAEKQPGFAKVFFYLEQEVMKPRYEIHSIGMPEIVEPAEKSQAEQRDRAARALFSATEIVTPNKFETKFGKDVPMTKYDDYWQSLPATVSNAGKPVSERAERGLREAIRRRAIRRRFMGSWLSLAMRNFVIRGATSLTFERARWAGSKKYYVMRSAGPDGQLNTDDDLQALLLFQRKWIAGPPSPESTRLTSTSNMSEAR